MKRKALLIGVSEYECDALENLPVVQRDLEILHTALEQSHYTVRLMGTEGIVDTGQNKILRALRKELLNAGGADVLLLYFSGHGIHYEGRDYLVPSDADFEDPNFTQYLITPDALRDAIDSCNAKTILFVVDACRHGIKLGIKEVGLNNWSRGEVRKATHRSYVMIFACGPGEVSQYVSGESGASLFTHAFSQALDTKAPACTLEEVLTATQETLDSLVESHNKKAQRIRHLLESEVRNNTLRRVICESKQQIPKSEEDSDIWSEAALTSPLWPEDEDHNKAATDRLKKSVSEILKVCWHQWQRAREALPDDAWRDENLPVRVLDRLDLLTSRSDPPVVLSAAEVALVISVPFIREAVLSSGVSKAASLYSIIDFKEKQGDSLAASLSKVHMGQPRFVRKAKLLTEQNKTKSADAVMSWLMHQCLSKNLEIWSPESDGGHMSDELSGSFDGISSSKHRLVKNTLTKDRLIELARCMFSDYERIDRDDRPSALKPEVSVRGRSYSEEQVIREKLIAYLLKLAGLLAIDVRTLSDVIADHIGLADHLDPKEAIETISRADWKPAGRGRKLTVTCHHPAIDLALHEHVGYSEMLLTHISREIGEKVPGLDALSGLPSHFLPDGIKSSKKDGEFSYQKPHINFQLSHDEIRELLMGEQLYGDPTLAVRELYQNALDACRYKRARLQYLKVSNKYEGREPEWNGSIVFRQSKDEQGREYIECEDNGIGMGMQHISQCFARAGKRFSDLPEFIEERSDWLQYNIELFPNSQFGVGVLSYFMLADEIEIETCRLDRQGRFGKNLRIRIPGSSGLFRIKDYKVSETLLNSQKGTGTRVRLYLNRTHYKGKFISCIDILRQLLWIAEFPTRVEQGARREVWEPNILRHPKVPLVRSLKTQDNVWWVPALEHHTEENGCLLADGIYTEEVRAGLIVNLKKKHYPKLTVDRKKILRWDREYVVDISTQNINSLLNWSQLDLEWLWSLSKKHPRISHRIIKALIDENKVLQLGRALLQQYKKSTTILSSPPVEGWLAD